ncbi:MAG: DNA-3-methyladenine glycosylase I [Candidatus Dactylopiibacterium sp.]|nr:DNA-3-methyladenine glycosylase I [Candidatus Dactylopiibacterium sp.]
MSAADPRPRCAWLGSWATSADPLYRDYHDTEWGVPCRDERALFELLCLEGAQAGLSWITVLKKRENYRAAFRHFDIEYIATLGEADVERLMQNPGIIRNRAKILATIGNARAWLALRAREGDVAAYLWRFAAQAADRVPPAGIGDIPARTAASDALSKALLKDGFKFVGSTICYAFMQASGMVNDHTPDCFCHPRHSESL